jgi:selenocysteine lyase/cysteine desulfurase
LSIEPLIPPGEFVGLEGVSHLCTGGEGPWLKSQGAVYERFCRLKSGGHDGRAEIYATGERCRERMGKLWGVPARRIAFLPTAAEGVSWLARGLDWRGGDNVVTTNLEFPSVAYGWRDVERRGVEVKMVPHRDLRVDEEDLVEAMDHRTRVLAISHVSFYTGQCHDLARLSEAARKRGALFVVDATHSSGALRVPASLTDLTVSSSYKWMLATHGTAPCYLSERAEAQTASTSFGWHNLAVWPKQKAERLAEVDEVPMPERLEPGNPAMQVVMHLDEAVGKILETGPERVETHARDLAELTASRLSEAGYRVISPGERAERSGNTCFEAKDAEEVTRKLAGAGVLVWGEFGRVRVSTHVHNGSEDVERLMKALRS